jgi:hypothetical protein
LFVPLQKHVGGRKSENLVLALLQLSKIFAVVILQNKKIGVFHFKKSLAVVFARFFGGRKIIRFSFRTNFGGQKYSFRVFFWAVEKNGAFLFVQILAVKNIVFAFFWRSKIIVAFLLKKILAVQFNAITLQSSSRAKRALLIG